MKKLLYLFLVLLLCAQAYGQTVRSIELNTYKYIVIDEISGKHSGEIRRFFVKNLKKSGFKVVNLKEPLQTDITYPQDLIDNPNNALYLIAEEETGGCFTIRTNLADYQGEVILTREGKSCGLLSSAIKKSTGIKVNIKIKKILFPSFIFFLNFIFFYFHWLKAIFSACLIF